MRALTLTVALALVSSPLLWSHYLALLLVPLALLRPRLHWVWLLPVLMWVSPLGMTVHTWQVLVSWARRGRDVRTCCCAAASDAAGRSSPGLA